MMRCMKNSQMGLLIKVLLIRKAYMRFIIMPSGEGDEEGGCQLLKLSLKHNLHWPACKNLAILVLLLNCYGSLGSC